MSLKVWLPLDGDLRNLGASNVEVTNNGATINNSGKIGSCYHFGTTASSMSVSKEAMTSCTTECSVTFWLKIKTWNTSYATYFQAGLGGTPWTHYIFGFLRNATGNTACFTISNGSSASNAGYLTSTLELNKWYHIALTYKTGKCAIYLNGILDHEYSPYLVPAFSSITHITLGTCNNGTGYQTDCDMNDFRIYDHCLSAAEVHEIAQGLVLHYKLDNGSQEIITNIPSTNVYTYPTFNASSASGGWNHWGPSGHSGSYGQNTDKKYIYNKNNTYSHWITENAGTEKYYLIYQSPAFEGGYRSLQAIIKEENSLPITDSICCPDWNARNGGVPIKKWTSIQYLGDGFYYCRCEGISQNGSNDLIGIDVLPGYKIYISECYLENDVEKCSPIFSYSSNIIQDSSGYGHNGTCVNAITSLDTPRYNSCISCSSEHADYTNTITGAHFFYCNMDMPATNAITVTWWGKNIQYGRGGIFETSNVIQTDTTKGSDYNSTAFANWDTTFGIYNGATRVNIYSNFIKDGNWHHHAIIFDGTNVKYYCDSVLKQTSALTGTLPSWKSFCVGLGKAGGAWRQIKQDISDFRIYCTPLLDTEIKLLYHIGMRVDNLQNIHSYEFNETQSNIFKSELIKPFAKSGATTGIGEITNRNDEPAIVLRQAPFEQNLKDNKSGFLQGYFAPNTSYIFDIWEDTDDVMSQYYGAGGFMIDYTDGTAKSTFVVDGGNKGFQHIQFITPATKSIDRLEVFGVSNVYYKLNSYICPVGALKIMKNGIFVTSNLVEDGNAALHESGIAHSNEFIEI